MLAAFVTGSTGCIARNLIDALLPRGVEVRGLRGMKMVGTGTIAYLLVLLGTAALLAAALQYSLRVQDLCSQGLGRKPSIEFVVAVLLVVLGLGAFSSLVLKL